MAYDVAILPRRHASGCSTTDRCFVIADEGVQLTKANTFTGVPEGGWYVDLVEVEELTPKQLIVQDVLTAWTDFPPFSTV